MKEYIEKGEIIRAILVAIGVVGIFALGGRAPNFLPVLMKEGYRNLKRDSVSRALKRLVRRGFLTYSPSLHGWRVELTPDGEMELMEFEAGIQLIEKPKRWDRKWRILIFDIPERRKSVREQVRKVLKQFNFHRLQDSVWAYPFECECVLELLRTKYHVRHEALYLRTETLSNDSRLRRHFCLESS